MRFKTEIEVVSAADYDVIVEQVNALQRTMNELNEAAAERTDWKKQCEDLLAERDELKVNHEDSVRFAAHWMEKFDELCAEHEKVCHRRDEALEQVNQQAQALRKAAQLNLQLKEEVERLRAELEKHVPGSPFPENLR